MKNQRYYHWQIAYKHVGEESFTLIDNPKYAWAADPFLVKRYDKLYLFAELFLYKSERNGVIGYCIYENGSFSNWKITMDEHWHLSYPNVFVKDDKLMMCPESYQKKEVSIYELDDLDKKWSVSKTIINNIQLVDATFLSIDEQCFMFAFEPTFIGNEGRLVIYRLDDKYNIIESKIITDDVSLARPGGNFINRNGELYRVCQIGVHSYGEGITITKVKSVWPEYKEEVVMRIYPQDIKVNSSVKYEGMHTYNCLDDIEVIDLKYYKPSISEYIASKRTKKVFTNKY